MEIIKKGMIYMKKLKRMLAFTVAMMSVMGVAACGNSDDGNSDGNSSVVEVEKVEVDDTSTDIEDLSDDVQTELVWMGTYDLNPDKGQDTSVEMTLFNNRGGTVKWIQVTDDEKFDKLASAIMSKQDVPDIFKYEWLSFPYQTLKDMYQPIDPIVDFSDPLWSGTSATADQFVLNGEHYVAPISASVGTMIMYDNAVIAANNLDDPYELYLEGEWNWDNWQRLMQEFCAGGDDRYGINGWFQPQIIQQTGKTMVNYENGKFVSNLDDPDIERAEGVLYDLYKNGLVNTNWLGNAKGALGDGSILFYSMGTWAMTGNNGPVDGDDWGIVPIPSDPNNDEKVMTADMLAYMWVKGSTAKDAVKTWFECCRIAATDEAYQETGRQKFMNANPLWTDEMYETFRAAGSDEYRWIFDYGYGVSSNMSSTITPALYEGTTQEEDGVQNTWTHLKETYAATVQQELDELNKAIEEAES